MFSRRGSPNLPPNLLARATADARARGQKLVDLTCSNPTLVGLPYDELGIARALTHREVHRYHPEPLGLDVARRAVAETWQRLGLAVDLGQVVLTASTSEAYSYCFRLLCDPGDEVLVPEPSYPLFEHLARLDSVIMVPYRLGYDGAWHIDLDTVRRSVNARTRAVILVSPNNPTGSFTSRAELTELAELGLPLISDEVFAAYPLGADPRRADTTLEAEGVLTMALGGLSKLAALPQHKLGWITVGGPKKLAQAALERLEWIADTYLSVNAAVQHGLAELLELTGPTRQALAERLRSNLESIATLCDQTPLTLLRPQGGWYAVLRLPNVKSEEEWVLGLLAQDQVLVQPGWFYDFAEEPYLVVSLLTPEAELLAGCERLLSRVVASTYANSP
jgi:aspartate/methionine/tyrosine aminotransferase